MNFTDEETQYSSRGLEHTVDSLKIIVGVIFIFLICFGLVFNTIVIHAFRKNRRLQTPTNYFIVGLTINDLVMVLLGMPFVAVSSLNGSWMFGHVVCVGYGILTTICGVTSICILTAIALDRFLVVTKSHVAKKITVSTVQLIFLGCYGYGIIWALMPLMGWGGFILEESGISCGPDWQNQYKNSNSYNIAILIFVFVVPLSIITWCYVKIILRVRTNRIAVRPTVNNAYFKRQVNVSVAVFCAIITFILAWAPYAVLSMWTIAFGASKLSPVLAILPHILAKSSSAWNPLIYVARNQDFRKAFCDLITNPFNGNSRNSHHESPHESQLQGQLPHQNGSNLANGAYPVHTHLQVVSIAESAV